VYESMRTLPLFPLPIVLFPGTAQALHIFEPRYRAMVESCLESDRRFGLTHLDERRPRTSDRPEPGDVGCTAFITDHQPLPDGRSNIATVGEDRFIVHQLRDEGTPYYAGSVEFFRDTDTDDPGLADLATTVRALLADFLSAIREFNQGVADPELPEDAADLSFALASVLEMERSTKDELFRLTSARLRLQRLEELLKSAVAHAARRAAVDRISKGNGRASHLAPSDS
jgi:ATP-dependent Lon protease